MTQETQKEWLRRIAEERREEDEERQYHWRAVEKDWAIAKAEVPPQEMLKISQPKGLAYVSSKEEKMESNSTLYVRFKWFLWRWLTR